MFPMKAWVYLYVEADSSSQILELEFAILSHDAQD
jgi:hypothetical protein